MQLEEYLGCGFYDKLCQVPSAARYEPEKLWVYNKRQRFIPLIIAFHADSYHL